METVRRIENFRSVFTGFFRRKPCDNAAHRSVTGDQIVFFFVYDFPDLKKSRDIFRAVRRSLNCNVIQFVAKVERLAVSVRYYVDFIPMVFEPRYIRLVECLDMLFQNSAYEQNFFHFTPRIAK